jgi:peroxiredoxin
MAEFEAKGARIVAVSTDPLEDTKAFAEKDGLTFPLLLDPDLHAIRAFGVEDEGKDIAIPSAFIVKPPGAGLTWIRVGGKGHIPDWDVVLQGLDPLAPATPPAQ